MPLLMKHNAALAKGGGGGCSREERLGANVDGRSGGCEIIRGRTPIIFHSESGSDSSCSPHGCPSDKQQISHHERQRATSSRRPPPYRTVPLPWPAGSSSGDVRPAAAEPAAVRARSVPPQSDASVSNSHAKPARPKSLHQELLVNSKSVQSLKTPPLASQPMYPSAHNAHCYPLRPSVSASAFPLSVSLQFDCLSPEWSTSELPVPSPAPAERRHFVRPSRPAENQCNPAVPTPRSSSVPRAQSPSRGGLSGGRPARPLSHPAGPVGSQWALGLQPANELRSHESLLNRNPTSSLSSMATSRSHGHLDHRHHRQPHFLEPFGAGTAPRWPPNCLNGFQLGATPAPAPSPSSTPSPSSRPLSHLPNDALRTNHGIRMLETKLDLYVDIMHAQERFVQVSIFSRGVDSLRQQRDILFSRLVSPFFYCQLDFALAKAIVFPFLHRPYHDDLIMSALTETFVFFQLYQRVQQLQASMDDASNRLVPAETIRSKWINPIELSPQQVQQQMDQLKELSDKIAPVQLTIEEVNDQAARLADSGVPLSHANLSRLDDLNSRWKVLQSSMDDRYQQLCGVTREGALTGPLLHSFLASSVDRPWERSVTEADVPYYVNHQTETTHWDHPQLEELMNSLSEFNDVRFSAYRMALKLRRVQKFLCLDKLELNTAIDTFDAHGLRAQNDKVIDIPDMVTVLRSLYEVVVATYPGEIRLPLVIDLCLNWILNVYDRQYYIMCYYCHCWCILSNLFVYFFFCVFKFPTVKDLFRLIADPNRLVDAPKLGVLLHDCVQMPRELGEVAAFGGSNIEPSVKCCFEKAGKQRQSIEAVHFLAWMKREPQSVVWLPVLHRLAASESARHQSKCNVCKATPIIGLRYRCLKCLSFDMCQNCFFTGRVSKHHKLTHPMQEYCTTTTSGEDLKDFTRTLRNKFKSKRYFKKHPRLGYLPVQTALEGTTTPSDAQSEVSSQMPSSAAQDVLVHSAANSVVDGIHKDFTPESEDEHQLIAQYCRSLNGDALGMSMGVVPRSPVQLIAALDSNHKEEIETMIRELEEENATLQAEYERLRSQQSPSMSFSFSSSPDDATPIPHQAGASSSGNHTSEVERDMLAEARLLRQHKTRLEARMKILEEHNRQLETQLSRLRQLLDEPGGNSRDNSSPAKTGTLQTRAVTAAHLATDTPVRTNGHDKNHTWAEHSVTDRLETRPPPPPHGNSNNSNTYNAQNVGNLLFMAGDLGKAVGSLVNVMTDDHSPGLTDEED
ncbi:hypothetical protein GHT06_017441 [Daphnia sinensis]|uniref:Dystrophin n=1 Tax=Daphnia sinensis TaxID=1820382 RepID=A0AAD5LH64_9CRUS|nr:hypothetical protein GHT06_017441 [Daphnia sinensis]